MSEVIDTATGELIPAERQMRGEVLRREDVQVTTADALELANEMRAVVKDRNWFSKIQGREYLNVEAWTFIGGRLGLTAKTSATPFMHPNTGEWIGYNGHASIYDRRTGEVVAEADHICLFEEPTRSWPVNHAVGMCQTRAVSRAYQEQFRWIAQLAGYEGTPAEEMSGVGEVAPAPAPRKREPAAPPPRENGKADPGAQAFLYLADDPAPPKPKWSAWKDDTVTAKTEGPFAGKKWSYMLEGKWDGGRYKALRSALNSPKMGDEFKVRARCVIWELEQREYSNRADREAAKEQYASAF